MSDQLLMPQSMLGIGGGGLVAPRSGGDFDYMPMAYATNMRKIFGRMPGPLDSAALALQEDGVNLDWSPIDREYDHRALTSLDPMMTAQAIQESAGMPFVMLATQMIISHEKKWTITKRERYMDGYVEVGPTGIPRSSNFSTRTTSGVIGRFKHWHQMPNEKLADPNFGLDNYLDMLEDFKAQLNHTIMIQVATEIASRNHRNLIDRGVRLDRPYTYLDHYRATTAHFCAGAMGPDYFTRALQVNMTGIPRMNTVILADVNQGALKDDILDHRAFPCRVRDETPTTRLLAEQLDQLRTSPVGVLNAGIGSPAEDNILLTIPTFHAHSDEPVHFGYQPLEREILLGGSYEGPDIDYATAEGLSGHATATSVLQLESNDARWKRVRFSDALRATNGGFVFENTGPLAGPSKRVELLLESWNELVSFGDYYRQHLAGARNRDTPSPWAKEMAASAATLRDIHGFREFPQYFHPNLVPSDVADPDGEWMLMPGGPNISFVRRLGQFTEDVLPISHLVDVTRAILRHAKKGNGQDAVLAQVLGLPADAIRAAFANDKANQWDSEDSSAALQIIALAKEARTARDTKRTEQARPTAPKAPKRSSRPAAVPKPIKIDKPSSIVQELMRSIPDSMFESFAPIAPSLEAASKDQNKAVSEIATKLRNTATEYGHDSGLHRLVLEGILAKLDAMGINARTPLDAPMPTMQPAALKAVRVYRPDEQLMQGSVPTGQPSTFTKAGALGGRTSELGDAATLGYPEGNVDDLLDATIDDDFPVDFSHFSVLPEIMSGLTLHESALLFFLMALPFDVPTLARLDELGIKLFNWSVERVGMRLRANSAIVMRRGGETIDWIMSPIRTEVTCQGVVGITDFVVSLGMGARWKAEQYVRELYGIFPSGILQGWGVGFMESIEEFVEYCNGSSLENGGGMNDCFLNIYPITEKKRSYPGNILGGPTITDRERNKHNESPLLHANSGHSFIRQLMTGTEVEDAEGLLNAAAEGLWNGAGRAIQPIIERMGNYHPTVKGKYSIPSPGTGPMGPMIVNDINKIGSILNGMGGQFSGQAPMIVACT